MVYFVKITKVYTAQVDSVTPFNKAVDYLTDSINCMIATHPFLKPNCLAYYQWRGIHQIFQ